MSNVQAALIIGVSAVVTALIRFLPFVIFSGKRSVPKIVLYLGSVLPYAIIGMLCVYCLKSTTFDAPGNFLPQIIAGAIVVGTYVWKRNTLISIVSGTLCYMILIQLVFTA